MKKLLQAEAIAPFVISILLINRLDYTYAWWIWILLFLMPDLSMIGYLFGNRIGAVSYNIFHHQLLAVIVAIVGLVFKVHYLDLAGLILLGHSSLDRYLGYGLKLNQGFKFTHLGTIRG